ncbi:MAG: hypothetical protein COA50_03600 [Flavobacteriaceae bacterium]|nr:MAG: hypothetical protein COA50_03600 [Flavobacteriaceae bacterium]
MPSSKTVEKAIQKAPKTQDAKIIIPKVGMPYVVKPIRLYTISKTVVQVNKAKAKLEIIITTNQIIPLSALLPHS